MYLIYTSIAKAVKKVIFRTRRPSTDSVQRTGRLAILIFLLVAYFSLDLSVQINVCSVSMPMTKAMTMTLTGREEEDQSSYYIKLKLASCRLQSLLTRLCYGFF